MTPTPGAVRVGLVGLETSHPAAFAPILRDLGYAIAVVHDLPGTGPPGRAERFAREHGIPVVARDETELSEACDVVILLGCDWDAHFSQAIRLLDRNLGVVLDKPLAGRVGDLRRLERLIAQGAPIAGGSSLRFANELVARHQVGADPSLVVAGCAGHPFYYGVHATSSAAAVLGPGVESVRAEVITVGFRGIIKHAGGAQAVIDVRPGRPGASFYVTVVSEAGVEHFVPDATQLYSSYLTNTLSYVVAPRPEPIAGATEPELSLLAMRWSLDHGGGWVDLDSLPDDFAPWPGREFLRSVLAV